MKIEPFVLPLIVAAMEKIAGQTAALEKTKGELQEFMKNCYGVDIFSGDWSLDIATGELHEVPRPDNGRPPDPD